MADITNRTNDSTLYDENGNAINVKTDTDVNRLSVETTLNTHSANGDAFGKLRVSNPHTIFESKASHYKDPLFWDEQIESGSGISSTHSHDKANIEFLSTVNTACKFTRRTYMRFNYQPGKSQLILMTGVLNLSGGGTGVERRIGAFDDKNGIFFLEKNNGQYYLVIRSSTSGTPVDNEIAQANWNIDKLDGTGKSGVTVDFTKAQLFFIDYQWLGVGTVRMGVVIDGVTIIAHRFQNSNNSTLPFISKPNLPLCYQMITTSSSPASSMSAICQTVISEGGQDETGQLRYFSNGVTHINVNTKDTIYALIGIRLSNMHIGTSVIITNVITNVLTSDDIEWLLILNPTVSTPVTFADQPNSAVQTAVGNTGNPSTSTVTGGTILAGGYVIGGSSSGVNSSDIKNAILLGSKIDGTRDEIYLCARTLGSNANVCGGITWRETH